MKVKKIFLLLTLIITLGIAFTIPKKIDAMEKSDLITIDADDFVIYVNDLVADIDGDLSGSIQFRYTYNYYLAHGNNNIYVGGYGLNNYIGGFKTYYTPEGYDPFPTDRLSYNAMSFVANSFITNHEYPKSVTSPPNGTYDIIIGDDSVNATTMEPGFPTTTYSITIVLTYTIDPSEITYDFTDYNINDSKPINDFKFYVYESDHMDGYDEGYDLGTDLGFDTGYTQGYISGRNDYGYYDPDGWVWRDYEYGYASGVLYGELETSSDIFVNGISTYINPDTGVPYIQTNAKDYIQGYAGGKTATAYDIFNNGIFDSVIGYINPDTGLPYSESASHDYQQGFVVDSTTAYNEGYNDGYVIGSTTSFMAGIDTWIVPAIIIVLIGGGFIAFAKMRNKGD